MYSSMEEYVAALEQAQLPQELVDLIKYLFTEVLDGRNAFVSYFVSYGVLQRARPRSALSLLTMHDAPLQPACEPERCASKGIGLGAGLGGASRRQPGAEGSMSNQPSSNQLQLLRVRKSRTSRSASSRFQP